MQAAVSLIKKVKAAGVKAFETLYINDLDHGPYISDTLRLDPTTNHYEALVEIWCTRSLSKMMFQAFSRRAQYPVGSSNIF